jgi:hypothetical protein
MTIVPPPRAPATPEGIRTWEVDFDVRLRRTLVFRGPLNEDTVRQAAAMLLSAQIENSAFLKWTDGRTAYRPMPVEREIGNSATIIAVREVQP